MQTYEEFSGFSGAHNTIKRTMIALHTSLSVWREGSNAFTLNVTFEHTPFQPVECFNPPVWWRLVLNCLPPIFSRLFPLLYENERNNLEGGREGGRKVTKQGAAAFFNLHLI